MINHDAQLSGNAAGAPFAGTAAPSPGSTAAPLIRPSADGRLTVARFAPLHMGDNAVAFAFTNNSHRPRHLEARAEVVRPDGSRITHTATDRCEAYEAKTATFGVPALFEGRYALHLQLVDVGTGDTLAMIDDAFDLEAFAAECEAADKLVDAAAAQKLAGDADADDSLSTDMIARLTAARERVEAALGTATEGQPTPKQRRTAIDQVYGALRELERGAARIHAAAATAAPVREFAVVPDTTLRKVFKDEPYLTAPTAPVSATLTLAKNEYEGLQLVVVPLWKDLEDLRVSVGDLVQVGGAGRIASGNVTVHRVGYVEIGPSEYNWFVEKQGFYPDVLFPDAPVDVPADQDAQPFFVTVKTDADTPAGDYLGTVRVEADGCAPVDLPLEVHVWGFALPKETHLKVSLWMNEGYLQRFYKFEDRTPLAVRKRFYDYHLAHRASPIKDFPLGGGALLEDFEYLVANGQNCFFLGLPEYLDEAQREPFAERLRATRDLLREKGWDRLGLIYTRDEVAVVARHLIPKVVEMNHWVKTVLPDWPRLQTSAPEQALFDAVDVWCPTIDHFDPAVLEERMAQGDRLWFYTVWGRPGIMIEFPATDHRLMFWMCWKYGAEGFLYWGTTHWDLNTTTDQRWPDIPWIPYNRQPGHNGCGYLLYPGPDGTPLGSIRFELLRDGIEDYEYFYLLRDLLGAAGDEASQALRARAETELAVVPEVLADHETFTEDPEVLLGARHRIAVLIEALAAQP